MVVDVKHTLILCAELFRSLWTCFCVIHLQPMLSFLFLFSEIFFQVGLLVDYFLNQGGLGHITFHFYSASTNKREQLKFLTMWSLVHYKLNHNHQLILHRQLNNNPALLY